MSRSKLSIALALSAVYLFWGATYLAMKFAIQTIPPYLMAGTRFMIAGSILFAWELLRGARPPQLTHWKSAAGVGALLLLGGNGGVVWGEQTVPSGIAAVIVATVPLWMAAITWLRPGGKRPSLLVTCGLLLGFSGIVLLVKDSITRDTGTGNWLGYAVIISAALSWSLGSILSRDAKVPASPLMAIALQNLTGGLFCVLAGLLLGESANVHLDLISARSLLAFIYLIFFGSIIGFSAYIWLLSVADPTVVSTYAYVNPVIAVFLGWALAGEKLTLNDGLAAVVIISSVVMITLANSRKKSVTRLSKAGKPTAS